MWPILHGLGNVGTISVDDLPGIGPFEGMTVRPVRSGAPHLEHPLDLHRGARTARPPAHRSFSDGVGTFYGDDVFEGRPIAVRFEWTSEGPDRATWQQAFSPDERRSWELNGGCPNGRPCCDVLV